MIGWSSTNPLPLAILISGQGTNLQAIINAIAMGLPAKIQVVVSDQSHAYGLIRAQQAHIATEVLTRQQYPSRDDYDAALIKLLDHYQFELIILAGFMRILTPGFLDRYSNRILNIHPSLLPKYPGLNTYQRALTAKERRHGATVHLVTNDLDGGPIIAQASFPVSEQDDIYSLETQTRALEYLLYPKVINLYAQRRLQFNPNRILFDHNPLPPQGLQLSQQDETYELILPKNSV